MTQTIIAAVFAVIWVYNAYVRESQEDEILDVLVRTMERK